MDRQACIKTDLDYVTTEDLAHAVEVCKDNGAITGLDCRFLNWMNCWIRRPWWFRNIIHGNVAGKD